MLEHRAGGRARQRDAAATREAILEAATRRFATSSYESTGVREIAADAGVTAALVNRYFSSKEGLFAEVIQRAFALCDHFGEGDRTTLAARLARLVVYGREDSPARDRVNRRVLVRSAVEPRAAAIFLPYLDANLRSLAESLSGPEAEARAAVILAQIAGFATLDELLRPWGLVDAPRERLVEILGASLAAAIG